MRKILVLTASILAVTSGLYAQEAPKLPDADVVTTLNTRLSQEIQRGFNCDVGVVGLQRKIAELEKKLAEAKASEGPKTPKK